MLNWDFPSLALPALPTLVIESRDSHVIQGDGSQRSGQFQCTTWNGKPRLRLLVGTPNTSCRSARQHEPNTKYSTDDFDDEILCLLRDSSEFPVTFHQTTPSLKRSEETQKFGHALGCGESARLEPGLPRPKQRQEWISKGEESTKPQLPA
jgi:hypothetical protein